MEVFVELVMFYGLLMSIALWDLRRRHNESKSIALRIEDVHEEVKELDAGKDRIYAKLAVLEEPSAENYSRIEKL